jgi:hypothetical protein
MEDAVCALFSREFGLTETLEEVRLEALRLARRRM